MDSNTLPLLEGGSPHLRFFSLPYNLGEALPYKGLMETCRQPGYVFWDFCLKQGIKFFIFCLKKGVGLSIFVLNRIYFLGR